MSRKTIEVCCYNSIELWYSRQMAIDFYMSCMAGSEGSERDRYCNILIDLSSQKDVCLDDPYDGMEIYAYCKKEGRYTKFKNGTNIRDVDGSVSYPY